MQTRCLLPILPKTGSPETPLLSSAPAIVRSPLRSPVYFITIFILHGSAKPPVCPVSSGNAVFSKHVYRMPPLLHGSPERRSPEGQSGAVQSPDWGGGDMPIRPLVHESTPAFPAIPMHISRAFSGVRTCPPKTGVLFVCGAGIRIKLRSAAVIGLLRFYTALQNRPIGVNAAEIAYFQNPCT